MTPTLGPGVFHGTRRLVREVGGLTLTEYSFPPNGTIASHRHEQSYLSLVLHGGWRESYGNQRRERKPWTLSVHPAGEIHSERLSKAGGRAFHVEFSSVWLRGLDDYAALLTRPVQVEGGPLTWLAMRLHGEFRGAEPHSGLIVEGLVLESIGTLARMALRHNEGGVPSWLSRARDILQARFSEPLSLQQVAQEIGVHPVHLARTFRLRYHCSIGEYLRQRRLEYACRALARSTRPVAEIAHEAGFVDQSHLSRTMRRFLGMPPGAFRRTRRPR